jgi:histidinol-phosphate aminotransferase
MTLPTSAQPRTTQLVPAPWAAGPAYVRAPQLRPIDLRLDANEGAVPDLAFLERCRLDARSAVEYPSARALEALLAAEYSLAPERVIVTAGADDAIERLCRVICGPGRVGLVTDPTFEMIPRFVRSAGGESISVPWTDGHFPVDAMLEAAAGRSDIGLICVVSPNNPTGLVATIDDLQRLREQIPGAAMLVDLAYGEFADEDLTTLAAALPGVVVTRTFSKAWGLAGLRVGYAICDPVMAPWLRTAGLPFAASGYSIAVAAAWRQEGAAAMAANVNNVRSNRSRLIAVLKELGARVTDSKGNFVFARFGDAERVADMLAGLGIAVRRFSGSISDALRITVPAGAVADRLIAALRAALAPTAILFDMDGVLADVSSSYREAIVRTCAQYGVAVTRDDIHAVKAAGDANNDWVVTQRLLSARGVAAPLPEVTSRFEAHYQGTDAAPGLRSTERLLMSADSLRSLAQRFRLGLVTGRPRADAERFLREKGIDGIFHASVCMEDAPLKPDPAPVRACLAALGDAAMPAWMIGDTRDDVVASRRAGVVPLGVTPPGASHETMTRELLAAGAARVLDNVNTLLEMLP